MRHGRPLEAIGHAMIAGSARVRLAEPVAALSLATDLGMGQPLEQALRTCLLAVAAGSELGLDGATRSDSYYLALLRFVGCTSDAQCAANEMCDVVARSCVCGAAFHRCGGACVPESATQCGPSCQTCSQPVPANSTHACRDGSCTFTCDAPYLKSGEIIFEFE